MWTVPAYSCQATKLAIIQRVSSTFVLQATTLKEETKHLNG